VGNSTGEKEGFLKRETPNAQKTSSANVWKGGSWRKPQVEKWEPLPPPRKTREKRKPTYLLKKRPPPFWTNQPPAKNIPKRSWHDQRRVVGENLPLLTSRNCLNTGTTSRIKK